MFLRPGRGHPTGLRREHDATPGKQQAYAAIRDLPAVTLDGVGVTLLMNAGLLIDVPQLEANGAAGIGLYPHRSHLHGGEQLSRCRASAKSIARRSKGPGGKPVVFRTLDIGSDKVLSYWERDAEENPPWAGARIRISLDRPAVLRQQLRSADPGRRRAQALSIMFPMVTEVPEFDEARAMLGLELDRATRAMG